MIRVILAAILVGLLTACGVGDAPDRTIVEKAIAMQVSQTQQELSQQLFRQPEALSAEKDSAAKIDRVKINSQQRMAIEDLNAYRVRGTYDLTLNLPNRRVTQHQNPFEVYLQRHEDNWQLAHPQPEAGWVTELIE